ncbi:formate-dependent phosphoribosylglycinamide formyltransferase [Mycolicibacterium sp. 120266]|jgi:phosphoribosylglycinamide formyltransferase 2|uniref:formate-dependent phosphoribosylglycinamide formyltransferase n=1 Tax=Mycolicibacterium sp. 120266 TaxID=3090601 RepID=UPI0039A599E8
MTEDAKDPTGAGGMRNIAAPVVMLLGSGEMSRELTLAFQRLGAVVVAVDRYADAPAHRVADRAVVVKMNDPEALTAVIDKEQPHFVVVEAGVVATDVLTGLSERVEVFPTPHATRLGLDREGLRRLAADELGLPTAPFWFAGSAQELATIAEHAGFPLTVTPVEGAPGDGVSVLLRAEDVEPAWNRAVAAGHITHTRVLAETVVDVDDEVTLLTVRTAGPTGPVVHFCEAIGHRVAEDGTLATWQPHRLSPAALDAAKSIAARIVNSLGGRGIFAVELLVRGDEVYFSTVRPRPDDTGLVTVRSQRLSQFDLHARAVLGLSVDTIMVSPGAAEVSYGTAETRAEPVRVPDVLAVLSEALEVAESDVRLFDRLDESDGRYRLGVTTATAPDVTVARDRAQRTAVVLRKLWQS